MVALNSLFVGLLTVSGLISLPVAAYIYRYRQQTTGGRVLVIVFVGQAMWALAYALQLPSTEPSWWLNLERFVVSGGTLVIAGWFLFALTYTGFERRLSNVTITGLLVPAAAGVGLAWTNPVHRLFWKMDPQPEVLLGAGGRYLRFEGGVLYDPWISYMIILAFTILFILGAKYIQSRSLHRSQIGVVLIATSIPFVGNLVFNVVRARTLAIDITPVLFTITSLLVVVALFRYRLLDSVPISQHMLLEQLSDAVIVTDDEHGIVHANHAARSVFDADLVGERLTQILPSEAVSLPVGEEVETSILVNGQEKHFAVNKRTYTNPRGDVRGTTFVLQDVTERVQRTNELARQNERLNEFANIVSHDLRNPLNVAVGRLDLAADECESEHLDAVEQSLDRMGELIDDMLSLASAGRDVGDFEPVELSELVSSCWFNVATESAELINNTETTVQADSTRLQQLLENLLRNGVEHAGSDVTIEIGDIPDGFYVEDDGPGIPADERENLFEPGYSSSESGTGFGLSIVREIAQAHNWEISVTEGSRGGARFEFKGVETA